MKSRKALEGHNFVTSGWVREPWVKKVAAYTVIVVTQVTPVEAERSTVGRAPGSAKWKSSHMPPLPPVGSNDRQQRMWRATDNVGLTERTDFRVWCCRLVLILAARLPQQRRLAGLQE
ncbi:hypothetical protein HPB50_027673 [Hyalomma asiaticum]|nr:hypothetical protein HPB50_027673 [Hyalomma asiaticum]